MLLPTRKRPSSALEDSIQTIIVLHADRIVLVIVAPRTPDRQPQDGSTKRIDHVGEIQMLIIGIRCVPITLANCQETRCCYQVSVLLKAVSFRIMDAIGYEILSIQIPCNLFAKKLIPWFIAMDRSDHPVTVLVSLSDRIVRSVSGRVCIPCNV